MRWKCCCVSYQTETISESSSCLGLLLKRRKRERLKVREKEGGSRRPGSSGCDSMSVHRAKPSRLFQMLCCSQVGFTSSLQHFFLLGSFSASTSVIFQERTGTTKLHSLICKRNGKPKGNLFYTRVCWAERVGLFRVSQDCGIISCSPLHGHLGEDWQQHMGKNILSEWVPCGESVRSIAGLVCRNK